MTLKVVLVFGGNLKVTHRRPLESRQHLGGSPCVSGPLDLSRVRLLPCPFGLCVQFYQFVCSSSCFLSSTLSPWSFSNHRLLLSGQSHNFKYHACAYNFHIYIFCLDFSPKFQTGIPNYLPKNSLIRPKFLITF